jgi:hypothetical protein
VENGQGAIPAENITLKFNSVVISPYPYDPGADPE